MPQQWRHRLTCLANKNERSLPNASISWQCPRAAFERLPVERSLSNTSVIPLADSDPERFMSGHCLMLLLAGSDPEQHVNGYQLNSHCLMLLLADSDPERLMSGHALFSAFPAFACKGAGIVVLLASGCNFLYAVRLSWNWPKHAIERVFTRAAYCSSYNHFSVAVLSQVGSHQFTVPGHGPWGWRKYS